MRKNKNTNISTPESNEDVIKRLKEKIVVIRCDKELPKHKHDIDKITFWEKAREVGKNPILDDLTPPQTIPAN